MSALQQPLPPVESPMIYRIIPQVMKEIGSVEKSQRNETQKYAFRGIEQFYQAAHPAFVKHGIFCAPEVLDREATTFEKINDFGKVTTWRHVTLRVRHRFFAPDGSFVDVTTFGEGLDNSDKASNKAMSGAMKYALIELFSVPTSDVEDSDRTSPEAGTQKTVARVAEAKTFTKPKASEEAVKGKGGIQATTEPPPSSERQPGEDDGDVEALADALAKKLSATIESEPGMVVNFARSFKDALPKHLQKDADKLRHDWLGMSFFMDKDGNPSSKVILKAEFEQWKQKACEWARMQK